MRSRCHALILHKGRLRELISCILTFSGLFGAARRHTPPCQICHPSLLATRWCLSVAVVFPYEPWAEVLLSRNSNVRPIVIAPAVGSVNLLRNAGPPGLCLAFSGSRHFSLLGHLVERSTALSHIGRHRKTRGAYVRRLVYPAL